MALVASEQQTKNALAAERARVHALEQERDAPEQPVYYAEALNLVCDELLKLAPSDYEARRDKIVAIIRNAAVAVRRCDNELTAERARIVGLRQS